MSNREMYKAAMSGVRHSDEATEKIFEMTVDKRQTKKETFDFRQLQKIQPRQNNLAGYKEFLYI